MHHLILLVAAGMLFCCPYFASAQPPSGIVGPASATPVSGADTPDGKRLMAKMESIVLPHVLFLRAEIQTVARLLTSISRKSDPEHIGVVFTVAPHLVQPAAGLMPQREVTLTLDNFPLREVVEYTCKQAEVWYEIKDGRVVFVEAKR